MADLAVAIDEALAERARTGGPGTPRAREIARGDGWSVADVVCCSGPRDRPFEEQHDGFAISIVASGAFRYTAGSGSELLTPGSLMLGSPGQCFECGHEHGEGDRCVWFQYEPALFERIAADAGARGRLELTALRLPPLRDFSPLVAQACGGISGAGDVDWERLALQLAATAIRVTHGRRPSSASPSPAARRHVAALARSIERRPDARLTLAAMARTIGLSPFHFLRTFEQVTGTPPHQFLMRARLREAARRLLTGDARVIDVALDCGYADPSRFSHAFRAEFGVSPRVFRQRPGGAQSAKCEMRSAK